MMLVRAVGNTEFRGSLVSTGIDQAQQLRLTESQRLIVGILLDHAGHVVTRERVLDAFSRGRSDPPQPKTIDVHVHKIRRKLKQIGSSLVIETVWDEGWIIQGATPVTVVRCSRAELDALRECVRAAQTLKPTAARTAQRVLDLSAIAL